MEALDFTSIAIMIVFFLGYLFITIEHFTKINKTSIALLMGILCWAFQFAQPDSHAFNYEFLGHSISDVSQVVFFLVGALIIVETINVHKGFEIIRRLISIKSKKQLLWVITILTFFLSAVLDNLTTTIVMISLLSKLMDKTEDRLLIGGAIVIAANAGGAWTPIGDVTTTMLWIGGQLTAQHVITQLFFPSVICMLAGNLPIHFMLKKGEITLKSNQEKQTIEPWGMFILCLGIGLLIFIPVFKLLTGLPPFMGVLFGVSILWLVTDIAHVDMEDRKHLKVPHIMSQIDLSAALFFLGILFSIAALEAAGLLSNLAIWLNDHVGNTDIIALIIGIASAIVDNVPLVAATMGMYNIADYPVDSRLWDLIAFCAGTGGSILIIGSAAGVVFMALEKVDFIWYFKRIALPAFIGYMAGMGTYLLLN